MPRWRTPVTKARRGGRGKPTQQALETLGNQFQGVMRADLKGAFVTFGRKVDYDAVADAVYSGDWRKVFEALPMDDLGPALTDGMAGAGRAMSQASKVAASTLADITLPSGGRAKPSTLSVGVDNDRVYTYVGLRTGELIQNVTQDLRTNVANAVLVGSANKLSPRETATLIRNGLPLNNRQQASLANYQAGLAQTNLSASRQADLTDRMRDALADERATTIARTEAQYAIQAGQRAVWDEALDQGLIGGNSMKQWVVEAEPCERCQDLAGVQVAVNEPFEQGGDSVDGPPLHVNCRCQVFLIPGGDL